MWHLTLDWCVYMKAIKFGSDLLKTPKRTVYSEWTNLRQTLGHKCIFSTVTKPIQIHTDWNLITDWRIFVCLPMRWTSYNIHHTTYTLARILYRTHGKLFYLLCMQVCVCVCKNWQKKTKGKSIMCECRVYIHNFHHHFFLFAFSAGKPERAQFDCQCVSFDTIFTNYENFVCFH